MRGIALIITVDSADDSNITGVCAARCVTIEGTVHKSLFNSNASQELTVNATNTRSKRGTDNRIWEDTMHEASELIQISNSYFFLSIQVDCIQQMLQPHPSHYYRLYSIVQVCRLQPDLHYCFYFLPVSHHRHDTQLQTPQGSLLITQCETNLPLKEQDTPASSAWLQDGFVLAGQSDRESSDPVQPTSSRKTGPDP